MEGYGHEHNEGERGLKVDMVNVNYVTRGGVTTWVINHIPLTLSTLPNVVTHQKTPTYTSAEISSLRLRL